jgi:hypothetical protein
VRWAAWFALAAGCLSSPRQPSDGELDAGNGLGDTAWQVALGASVPHVAAASGDAVVVAAFEGTVELESPITADGGGLDILVAGFDIDGAQRFAEAYGGPAQEFPNAIALSRVTGQISVVGIYGGGEANAGGEVLPASTGYSLFAARYLDGGAHEWSLPGLAVGGVYSPTSISIGGSGGIALAGAYLSTLQLGPLSANVVDDHDLFFARLDQNGDVQTLAGYGAAGYQSGTGALEDRLGSIYLFGTATAPFTIGEVSPDADTDGAMFVVPVDDLGNATSWMLDTVGGAVGGLHAATLPDGSLLLAGWFDGDFAFDAPDALELDSRGGTDVFIAVIEPDGQVAWLEQFGGEGDDVANGVAVAPDGRFALTGGFHGVAQLGETELASEGNSDAFVIAFEADGAVRWARSFGGVEDDKGHSVAVDDDGAVLLGAIYRGEVDFGGPAPLSSGGGDGGALIRLR